MLQNIGFKRGTRFVSGSENSPLSFHLECLSNSTQLDLLLGYFSSSAISMLSLGFATFIYNGGKVRLAINHILSPIDKQAIEKGLNKDIRQDTIDPFNIKELAEKLNGYDRHFFECFAWLIANDRIEFVIIQPKDGQGIAHYKEGIYSDGKNAIAFNGSLNFTGSGLTKNLESLDCFCSWDFGDDYRVEGIRESINDILEGNSKNVKYLSIEQVQKQIVEEFGGKDLIDLLEIEQKLLKTKRQVFSTSFLEQHTNRLEELIEYYHSCPRFPYASGPRDYQIQAYENWVSNGKKGLFSMATGTGKTLTSLNCLLNEYYENENYRAIIVVPTVALQMQWVKECEDFNFSNIFAVNSDKTNSVSLQDHLYYAKADDRLSYIIIVTYASFTRRGFRSYLNNVSTNTLFIADEAHNLGSKSCLQLLEDFRLSKRIGLSATPLRQYDDEGNIALNNFFNDAYPYCYSYSMQEAIQNKILCRYLYYPHLIELTDTETQEYIKITRDLMVYFDSFTKKFKSCKEVEILLLKRKRIIHQAKNKLKVFSNVIDLEYKRQNNTLKYTLVYAPEGINEDYSDYDQTEQEYQETLITEFNRVILNKDPSLIATKFTSETKEREFILDEFKSGNINVLTSMKCLDEGIDIPRTEVAIFCSSTGNPRQFIQRRGRVLRQHEDKKYAIIHDLVVIPKRDSGFDSFEFAKNIIKNELARVRDFSELSMNPLDTYEELEEILIYYGLNLYN